MIYVNLFLMSICAYFFVSPGFEFWLGVFLHGFCMFSPCMSRFSLAPPASHDPEAFMLCWLVWLLCFDRLCVALWWTGSLSRTYTTSHSIISGDRNNLIDSFIFIIDFLLAAVLRHIIFLNTKWFQMNNKQKKKSEIK